MSGLEEEEIGGVHIVHRSVVPLLFRVLFLVMIALVVFAGIYLVIIYFFTSFTVLLGIIFLVITFLGVGSLLVYVCLQWANDYYSINPKTIISKSGVFTNKEETFALGGIEEIKISQGFWGKIFNYGNLHLQKNRPDEKFDLLGIPNPEHFEEVLNNKLESSNK